MCNSKTNCCIIRVSKKVNSEVMIKASIPCETKFNPIAFSSKTNQNLVIFKLSVDKNIQNMYALRN